MSECLFCKIITGEIPAEIVFQKGNVFAFRDISPMAKDHFLFIHKFHTININEMIGSTDFKIDSEDNDNGEAILEVYRAIKEFSHSSSFESEGFRIVTNTGKNAGQSVFHTHFHFLGGERLSHFGS